MWPIRNRAIKTS